MKRNSALVLIFIFVSTVQNIIFCAQDITHLAFVTGLPDEMNDSSHFVLVFILISPLIIKFLFFNGTLQELTEGYGKLIIIRHYSKKKLLLKEFLKVFIRVIFLVGIQLNISLIFVEEKSLIDFSFAKSLVVYILAVFSLIMLELLIELYTESQYACLSVMIYTVISYFLKNIARNTIAVKIIFFPSLLFEPFREQINPDKDFIFSLIILFFIIICFITLNLKRFKNKDIF